jgi:hypothetical protein
LPSRPACDIFGDVKTLDRRSSSFAVAALLAASMQTPAADPGPSRYWAPFSPLPIQYDYVCPAFRGDDLEMWLACERKEDRSQSMLINQPIVDGRTGPASIAFTTSIVTDFPDRADPSKAATVIRLARSSLYNYGDRGYVYLATAFAGDPYGAGRHPLLPILFSSPDGRPGTWTYHGRLSGEPRAFEDKKQVWSDGGGIVPLADGRWRAYVNGYGVTLSACEAPSLDGPWTFVRDGKKGVRDLGEVLPIKKEMRGGSCFPFALKVSDGEYHLWISDQWEPTAVWHLTSEDGLDFQMYGRQPEITRADSGGAAIKGIRACVSPDGTAIHGWIPFLRDGRWVIHQSTMPVGLQPAGATPTARPGLPPRLAPGPRRP